MSVWNYGANTTRQWVCWPLRSLQSLSSSYYINKISRKESKLETTYFLIKPVGPSGPATWLTCSTKLGWPAWVCFGLDSCGPKVCQHLIHYWWPVQTNWILLGLVRWPIRTIKGLIWIPLKFSIFNFEFVTHFNLSWPLKTWFEPFFLIGLQLRWIRWPFDRSNWPK